MALGSGAMTAALQRPIWTLPRTLWSPRPRRVDARQSTRPSPRGVIIEAYAVPGPLYITASFDRDRLSGLTPPRLLPNQSFLQFPSRSKDLRWCSRSLLPPNGLHCSLPWSHLRSSNASGARADRLPGVTLHPSTPPLAGRRRWSPAGRSLPSSGSGCTSTTASTPARCCAWQAPPSPLAGPSSPSPRCPCPGRRTTCGAWRWSSRRGRSSTTSMSSWRNRTGRSRWEDLLGFEEGALHRRELRHGSRTRGQPWSPRNLRCLRCRLLPGQPGGR